MRKLFSKHIATALAIMYVFCLIAVPVSPVSATGELTLTVGSQMVPNVGDTVIFPVTANEVENIQAFGIKFDYDRTKLEFVGWSGTGTVFGTQSIFNISTMKSTTTDVNTNGLKPAIAYSNTSAVGLGASEDEGGFEVSGSGVLCYISFKVLEAEPTVLAITTEKGVVSVVNCIDVTDFALTFVDGGLTPAPKPVTAITVKTGEDVDSIVNGNTLQMYADVTPADADDATVIWSVATKEGGTATIDASTGLLTATGVGTVTVTATANDGSGITGSKDITITAAPVPISNLKAVPGNKQALLFFGAPVGATNVLVQQKVGAEDWTNATTEPLTAASTTATVTGLTNGTTYDFRLVVAGGANDGISNVASATPLHFTKSAITREAAGEPISAKVTITPEGVGGQAVVIFQLKSSASEPIQIVAVQANIDSSKEFTGQFPGYTGSDYTVDVLVWDKLENSTTYVGVPLL